jgi:hypothetical protein
MATLRRLRGTPSPPQRYSGVVRHANGRRRHVLLSAQARTGKRLPQTIPTDVTGLDTDDRVGVYCEVATDCTPTSSTTNVVLH